MCWKPKKATKPYSRIFKKKIGFITLIIDDECDRLTYLNILYNQILSKIIAEMKRICRIQQVEGKWSSLVLPKTDFEKSSMKHPDDLAKHVNIDKKSRNVSRTLSSIYDGPLPVQR